MKLKNKKGFTLIELLAAVVILGILMLVAIPRVSKYIDDSRKRAFVDTALAYVQEARYRILAGDIECADGQYIVFNNLKVDKGTKSPFGSSICTDCSYVQVNIGSNGEYTYSVYMSDPNKAIGKYKSGKYYLSYETEVGEDDVYEYSDVRTNNYDIQPGGAKSSTCSVNH